jgi:hypothetical protein
MPEFLLTDLEIRITVDPNVPLAELIRRGNFDRVDHDILPERYPIQPGPTNSVTLRFATIGSRCATTEELLSWIKPKRFRSARIEEILALAGALPPPEGLGMATPALGSPWIDPEGQNHYVAASLRLIRVLRCSSVKFEPRWFKNWHCFPIVRID